MEKQILHATIQLNYDEKANESVLAVPENG
jgi:hypothetical protein